MIPDKLPPNVFGFVGGTRNDGVWVCKYRWPRDFGGIGMWNCHCARYDDGGCVKEVDYPKFSEQRDKAYLSGLPMDRSFANPNSPTFTPNTKKEDK